MNSQIQVSRMARQSADVITHPNVRAFNYYAVRASDNEALLYVTIAAVVIGVVSLILAGSFDILRMAFGVVSQLFEFYIFAGLSFFVGQRFRGMGSLTTVAYTYSLFYVPILLLTWAISLVVTLLRIGPPILPLLITLLGLGAQAYYAYLAIQAAMYIRSQRDAALTVAIALAGVLLLQLIFRGGTF
ncbi:MAG TPA: hypothetical protein VFX76_06140 [Roseiflexaceae bacterium]|nr:hypothetical protein [Roseiflexaceae bacterium]